ncbi:MAG: cobalamin B12-binding domain-containing protein [Pseudomonadota bacterium]
MTKGPERNSKKDSRSAPIDGADEGRRGFSPARGGRLLAPSDNRRGPAGDGALIPALEETVIHNVIPRLVNRFGPGMIVRSKKPKSLISPQLKASIELCQPATEPVSSWLVNEGEKDRFMDMLNARDEAAALDFLEDLVSRGASFDDVCRGLITDVARDLGQMWIDDDVSFVTVSAYTAMLMTLLRSFSLRVTTSHVLPDQDKAALVSSVPGEQHVLGTLVVQETLRRAGWHVAGEQVDTLRALYVLVRKQWFTLAGISVSTTTLIEQCAKAINGIRNHSQNPNITVMVGGSAFFDRPDLVEAVGADIYVHDAKQALCVASRVDEFNRALVGEGDGNGRTDRTWMNESHGREFRSSKSLRRPSEGST